MFSLPSACREKKKTLQYTVCLPLPSLLTNDVWRSDAQLCYWCQTLTRGSCRSTLVITPRRKGGANGSFAIYVHFDFSHVLERMQNTIKLTLGCTNKD